MSTCRIRRLGYYEVLCFCISSCGQKKRVLCSKCDDPNFLRFGQHLPLGSVNVCCKFKYEMWEQLGYDDPVKTASMSTRRIRGVGLTKGCAFASAAVPKRKRLVCSKCEDKRCIKFADHLPLGPVNVW